jgi:hypothetical protein
MKVLSEEDMAGRAMQMKRVRTRGQRSGETFRAGLGAVYGKAFRIGQNPPDPATFTPPPHLDTPSSARLPQHPKNAPTSNTDPSRVPCRNPSFLQCRRY